jgi:hypothetical protein
MFWTAVKICSWNVTIIRAASSNQKMLLTKNHKEFPKVAQMVKNHPIWSPCKSFTDSRKIVYEANCLY